MWIFFTWLESMEYNKRVKELNHNKYGIESRVKAIENQIWQEDTIAGRLCIFNLMQDRLKLQMAMIESLEKKVKAIQDIFNHDYVKLRS